MRPDEVSLYVRHNDDLNTPYTINAQLETIDRLAIFSKS